MTTYGFLPVSVICIIIYFISYFLTKIKYLKFTTHRRIWNILLMVSFLIGGTIGVFMSVINSFDIDMEIPFFILQIHAGVGVVWFIIALFHFLWHLNYFKKAIKVLFSKG